MNVVQLLGDNWSLIVAVIFMVVGVVFTGKRLAYFKWANETLFFAWDQAEKLGVAQDLPAYAKIDHYLEVWRMKYREKYNAEPGAKQLAHAYVKASEFSIKEKAHRLSDPTSPSA